MANIDQWPSWNPDVSSASLQGELKEGSQFRWKAGPGTVTSILQRVDKPQILAWTGKTLGIHAIHVWRLESRNGNTMAYTEESWEGLVVRLLRGPMQNMLQNAIDSGLEHLKAEAERKAQSA
jgi:hypothetical protein